MFSSQRIVRVTLSILMLTAAAASAPAQRVETGPVRGFVMPFG